MDFEFDVSLFIVALEESAFDIAVLLHQEFVYMMRGNSERDDQQIVQYCVQSFNKHGQGSGMVDEKAYLIRVYMEHFKLRNARTLLDCIEKMTNIPNKSNLYVTNFNVVKTACVLIEILELLCI